MDDTTERARNRATVEAFLNVFPKDGEGFFEARKRLGLIADDYVFELPYAPPGMRNRDEGDQHLSRSRMLKSVFVEWHRTAGPVIYETLDPTVFWVEASGAGVTRFWGRDMPYRNDFVIMFVVKDAKVALFREYFNPVNLYPAGAIPQMPVSG